MNNLLNLKNIFVNASLLGLLLISGANPALAADQAALSMSLIKTIMVGLIHTI